MKERGHTGHDHGQNRFAAIPTPLRLDADEDATGRGVTIAVLDAGFRPHADLERPRNRVLAWRDLARPRARRPARGEARAFEWHGTQTAVVAAGNGHLSDGVYRSLAPDADVVLLKVGHEGRIDDEAVAGGLRWVIRNRKRFGIRIVTLSIGGDADHAGASPADVAAEAAVAAGIVVVVAAGNAGNTDRSRVVAPATAPSVITVGGFDDGNDLDAAEPGLYHSSFGAAVDGRVKPELVAPAAFVAAPIVDGTTLAREAIALTRIAAAPDYLLPRLLRALATDSGLDVSLAGAGPPAIRAAVEERIRERRIASAHYQHVEGTSFAAPIVASVVAQMLEADPGLDPAAVKRILVGSADRLHGAPALRQGSGALNARRAVEWARHPDLARARPGDPAASAGHGQTILTFRDPEARSVALAGAFNGWSAKETPMVRVGADTWQAEIDPLPPGRHAYKFVVDGGRWVLDPGNEVSEPDRHGGRNSVLEIEEGPSGRLPGQVRRSPGLTP